MKTLKDFKEDIHKCSKCGLCQSVCPLYNELKNECSVARGQFLMLEGVLKNKLKINKNINKYLDMCLKCNKCSEFCPSEINALDIILTAKYEYFKKSIEGKLYSFLQSKWIFNSVLNILEFFSSLFNKKVKQSKNLKYKAIYFSGCVGKLSPSVTTYVIKLLNRAGIEVIDKKFNCCGMPFLTTGNLERFKEQAIENVNRIDSDVDFFITDCASCETAWKEYHKYIDDETVLGKYNKIEFKNLYDILDEFGIRFSSKKNIKISYHCPCHEKYEDSILNLINNIENAEYIELDSKNNCCGLAGLEHPYIIKNIVNIFSKKRKSLLKSDADAIVTSCAGCLFTMSLLTSLRKKIYRLIAFFKDNCEII